MFDDRLYIQATPSEAELRNAILETLKYFNMFRFPLYRHEIHKFLRTHATGDLLDQALIELLRERKIFRKHSMYALENSDLLFLNRLMGSDVANQKLKEAYWSARVIANFPFVRGLCISGSLSKGYADENSDIDYFIIAAPRRLWICRTLLHTFKKLTFFFNMQHSFCMNYFIDESRMCLEEKNLFTATEVATLIPMYNPDVHKNFIRANAAWMTTHFPNISDGIKNDKIVRSGQLKRIIEGAINKLRPEKLNSFFMKLTDTLWRAKWRRKGFPMEEYDVAMKTKWYVSKQHPLNYQKKVLKHNKNTPAKTIAGA